MGNIMKGIGAKLNKLKRKKYQLKYTTMHIFRLMGQR